MIHQTDNGAIFSQWTSRTFARPVRMRNLPPFRLGDSGEPIHSYYVHFLALHNTYMRIKT